jgi:uncharacterized protein (TIGR02147 family)
MGPGESIMTEPSVFDYLDFRAYLGDLFAFHKGQNDAFSHREFARRAGFAAPNFLQLVIGGQRNLTHKSSAQVAKGFGLKSRERDFFACLVQMNQAKTHTERNRHYQSMTSLRSPGSIKQLESASYDYFSHWYIPVIREVASWGDGRRSAAEIAALLNPPVTAKEAERALKVLTELQLLRQEADGRWVQSDAALTTGPEVRSLVVANYHRAMIRLGDEAIERHPSQERDISALTLGISRERLPELKQKIAAFRRELLELAARDEEPQQVVQINFQLFPLTNPWEQNR